MTVRDVHMEVLWLLLLLVLALQARGSFNRWRDPFPTTHANNLSTIPPSAGRAESVGAIDKTSNSTSAHSDSVWVDYDRPRFAARVAGGCGTLLALFVARKRLKLTDFHFKNPGRALVKYPLLLLLSLSAGTLLAPLPLYPLTHWSFTRARLVDGPFCAPFWDALHANALVAYQALGPALMMGWATLTHTRPPHPFNLLLAGFVGRVLGWATGHLALGPFTKPWPAPTGSDANGNAQAAPEQPAGELARMRARVEELEALLAQKDALLLSKDSLLAEAALTLTLANHSALHANTSAAPPSTARNRQAKQDS